MEARMSSLSLLLLISSLAFLGTLLAAPTYVVTRYGAKGDGRRDDTKAFLATWKAACQNAGGPIILIPSGKAFLIGQINFVGPCKSSIYLQVNGNILRPSGLWAQKVDHWMKFHLVNGLTIRGSGQIDGRGAAWWACKRKHRCGVPPNALGIFDCQNVQLSGLSFINSPKMHVNIYNSNQVTVDGLSISAPGNSPNTDGIHIQKSHHVNVRNIVIGTGDDCVSIGTGTFDVNVSWISCGPGHGISIGSLGDKFSRAQVEQINVHTSHLTGTTNGLRIKTWQGGAGYARGILFENINFTAVRYPIIIDQFYCDHGGPSCHPNPSAVQVSDVRYIGLFGTSSSDIGINLKCSKTVGCKGIKMYNVNIRPENPRGKVQAYCSNAHGVEGGIMSPELTCLN